MTALPAGVQKIILELPLCAVMLAAAIYALLLLFPTATSARGEGGGGEEGEEEEGGGGFNPPGPQPNHSSSQLTHRNGSPTLRLSSWAEPTAAAPIIASDIVGLWLPLFFQLEMALGDVFRLGETGVARRKLLPHANALLF